jgi:hypothetical protein
VSWMDTESIELLKDESEQLSIDDFIKKFYDPDEIVKI